MGVLDEGGSSSAVAARELVGLTGLEFLLSLPSLRLDVEGISDLRRSGFESLSRREFIGPSSAVRRESRMSSIFLVDVRFLKKRLT